MYTYYLPKQRPMTDYSLMTTVADPRFRSVDSPLFSFKLICPITWCLTMRVGPPPSLTSPIRECWLNPIRR